MESFKTWLEKGHVYNIEEVNLTEETATPSVTTSAVAVPDSPFKTSKVAGCDCIEVDHDTYMRCKFGKKPYSRWSGYIEDENLRNFVRKHYSKSEKLLVMNNSSGAAMYFKR